MMTTDLFGMGGRGGGGEGCNLSALRVRNKYVEEKVQVHLLPRLTDVCEVGGAASSGPAGLSTVGC